MDKSKNPVVLDLSSLFTTASALCVQGFLLFSLLLCQKFTALAAAMSEALLLAGKSVTVINGELDLMCRKKRGCQHIPLSLALIKGRL
jgi:hypothetical protein